jgi:hypothetical protein
MTRRQAVRGIAITVSLTLVLLGVGMPQALAHKHPPREYLTGPGVVYIESGYHIDATLIEHSLTSSHIRVVQRSYVLPLVRGSGFAVDPSAVIVTGGAVVSPDKQSALNYGVNRIFQQTYGRNVTLPNNLLRQRQLGEVADQFTNENRLKACYDNRTNAVAGGCVIKLTRMVTVYPYVTNQEKNGKLAATVLTPAEGTTSDVAVLKVSAGSLPTVDVRTISRTTYPLGVIGFAGIPDSNHKVLGLVAHLDKPGGNKFKAIVGDNKDFAKVTPALLSNGLQGAPLADDLGRVIGLIAAPSPPAAGQPGGSPRLIGSDAVLATLKALNLAPARGPADGPYESAIHPYENGGYAASIPGFQKALTAYPGHYLAARYLLEAQRQVNAGKGGPTVAAPRSPASQQSPGLGWRTWLVVAVALLLAAVGAAWLIHRRRRLPPATAGTPPQRAAPTGAAALAPGAGPSASDGPGGGSNRAARPAGQTPSRASGPSGAGLRTESSPRADPSVATRSVAGSASRSAPQAPIFCTRCGGRVAPHHQFCGWCGEPFG